MSLLRNRPLIAAATLAASASLFNPTATAQDGWHVAVTPYLWLPALDTSLSLPDFPVNPEQQGDAFDVLDAIDWGILVGGQVRKDRIGLLFDFEYVDFSFDGSSSGGGFSYDAGVSFLATTLAGSYRVVDRDPFSLDLAAGARVLWAELNFDGQFQAALPDVDAEGDKVWVDPIVGVKAGYAFNEHWFMVGYADIGGFGVGSDLTWQALLTLGYSFNEHFAIQIGYRYFAVDFEDGDFKFDTDLYGPLIGLTFRN